MSLREPTAQAGHIQRVREPTARRKPEGELVRIAIWVSNRPAQISADVVYLEEMRAAGSNGQIALPNEIT